VRLLLDTHALLWAFSNSPKLSAAAKAAIADESNEKLVSAASAFEIATKHRLGKLPEFEPIATDFPALLDDFELTTLPITIGHAARAGALPHPHGDPFDRLLIAQALAEGLTLVSNEKLFDQFEVRRLW
jgi:PIN domain nuclease of toxin-antitoxin system